jgi:hypothetical protein
VVAIRDEPQNGNHQGKGDDREKGTDPVDELPARPHTDHQRPAFIA